LDEWSLEMEAWFGDRVSFWLTELGDDDLLGRGDCVRADIKAKNEGGDDEGSDR